MPAPARLLALALAGVHLVIAVAPCPGNEAVATATAPIAVAPDPGPGAEPPLAVKPFCPCGCKRGPAAVLVAGSHAAPPPAMVRVALPALSHEARESRAALPQAPVRPVEHVPLPA